MALVVHELVTNSAKYGALNDSSGSVRLDVQMQPDGVAHLSWREENGPPVQAPKRRGFGTTIIERSIPFELKGRAETHYRVTGFEADFVLPSAHVRPAMSAAAGRDVPDMAATADMQLDGPCLVLEDNMVIALDATDMLTDLGAPHVHTASTVADGLAILANNDLQLALLDVNLGDETSVPVIEKCIEMGLPTVLATGYGSNRELIEKFPQVPVLSKPYNSDGLKQVIARAFSTR